MSHVPAKPARGGRIECSSRREEEVLAGAVFLPRTSASARLCMNDDVRKIAVSELLKKWCLLMQSFEAYSPVHGGGLGGSEERLTMTSGRSGSRINASRAAGSQLC